MARRRVDIGKVKADRGHAKIAVREEHGAALRPRENSSAAASFRASIFASPLRRFGKALLKQCQVGRVETVSNIVETLKICLSIRLQCHLSPISPSSSSSSSFAMRLFALAVDGW